MPKLVVLSLGAGVQSTTLALMAAHGEIEAPDFAVFADTGNEPREVYDHLRWLTSPNVLSFPVHIASAGNIKDDVLAAVAGDKKRQGPSGEGLYPPPFYLGTGQLNRACTGHYKIDVIERRTLQELGIEKGGRRPTEAAVEVWIGISTDEAIRMKPSRTKWSTHRWPLIERRMSRGDCLEWMKRHDYPQPPKSACIMCPYRSDAGWRQMRVKAPAEFEEACRIDEAVRSKWPNTRDDAFVHRSLKPLREVDLSTAEDKGQLNLFNNECEGMCGV